MNIIFVLWISLILSFFTTVLLFLIFSVLEEAKIIAIVRGKFRLVKNLTDDEYKKL